MKKQRTVDVSEAVRDEPRVRKAMQQGVDAALQRRKQAGLPVAEWRDGKVVWISSGDAGSAKPAGKPKVKRRVPARPATTVRTRSSNRARRA